MEGGATKTGANNATSKLLVLVVAFYDSIHNNNSIFIVFQSFPSFHLSIFSSFHLSIFSSFHLHLFWSFVF